MIWKNICFRDRMQTHHSFPYHYALQLQKIETWRALRPIDRNALNAQWNDRVYFYDQTNVRFSFFRRWKWPFYSSQIWGSRILNRNKLQVSTIDGRDLISYAVFCLKKKKQNWHLPQELPRSWPTKLYKVCHDNLFIYSQITSQFDKELIETMWKRKPFSLCFCL